MAKSVDVYRYSSPPPYSDCESYQLTNEVIVSEDHQECDNSPIICPNECSGDEIERGMLQDHLDKCPFQVVECEFSHVGCQEKVRRCDLAQHLSGNGVHHSALSSKMIYEKLLKTIDEKERQLQKKDIQLQEKDRQLQEKDKMLALLLSEIRDSREESKCLLGSIYLHTLKLLSVGIVLYVTMTELKYKMDNKLQWFSPPYYTRVHYGYKMGFVVDFLWQYGTPGYLNIYSYMMKGHYDDHLQWPFQGTVVIRIVNRNRCEYVFKYMESSDSGNRVTNGERGPVLSPRSGYSSYKNIKLLKDDCLQFEVIIP